jgi:hypothetical protein
MHRFQPLVAVVCGVVLLAPPVGAQSSSQTPGGASNSPRLETATGPFARWTGPYRQPHIAPIDLSNSNRLESLLRAGKLYLSMQDVIALALENNLDIALQRYGPQIADANILRAKGGGFLRGVNASVTAGPTSATQGSAAQTGINQSAAQQAAAVQTTGNILVSQTVSPIHTLDPSLQAFMRWQHQTTPK